MEPDWQRVESVFLTALERAPETQTAFLRETCANQPALLEEVMSMLRSHRVAGAFLEEPAYQANAEILAAEGAELEPGQRLGPYKIVSLLGTGGMGEVYLAEDIELGRQVAIKLVKAGFGRAILIRHFRREERILAALNHPNIARLYGGAMTEQGVPYFVMEYVEGEPLDLYCQTHAPSLADRLQLFRKICSAVSYAHQHLVVHRDLKPANIRVTREGEPKLLDFGIAKLLDDESGPGVEQTMTVAAGMTPDYASPEQILGEPITTATDVYSLGVVLYELLTAQKPYQTKSRRLNEVSRAIIEQEPQRPSVAASNDQKSLRGDLDRIVLMAMRKEPARRYASVAQFSEDIRRYLLSLPIVARRDTSGYRASKFISRHKVGTALAVLIAFALVAGVLAIGWQSRLARQERDKAQGISSFLQDILGAAAPEVKGIDIKVTDILAEASARAKKELANQPGVMADVLMTLGRTYLSLGLYLPAEPDLRRALEASLRANGELHSTTATTLGWLGLGLAYQYKLAEGEEVSHRAVTLQRKLHPRGHENVGIALYALGLNLVLKGDGRQAEPLLHEAVDSIRTHLGSNHGYHVATLGALGLARERSGNLEGAEATYRQAIAVGQTVEPRYRIFLAQASTYLGVLLTNKGAYAEAETILRESERMYRELSGDSNVGFIKQNLGSLHFAQDEHSKAESEYRESIEIMKKYLPAEHPSVVAATTALGLTLSRLGRAVDGEAHLREALEIRLRTLPPENPVVASTQSALGECLVAQLRLAEAEPLLLSAFERLTSQVSAGDRRLKETRWRLVQLYESWEKPEQAERYR